MRKRMTVRHSPPLRCRQRGIALLVMTVIVAIGASWLLVSTFNAASNRTAQSRHDNARVLAEAKHALSGWMIRQAVEAGENNPGRLPCPEAAAYIGTANEGIAAGNCTLPAVGRLPWRTLGLPKLRDASGEPLWYVVSPGWALPTVVSTLTINSNSLGQLTLDGTANAAAALVIAPGAAMDVQASPGCTARTQSRNALTPDFRDYLECENAASPVDASFVTHKPAVSFNDQVVALTTRDLLPGLEAAIMKRIEREVVPVLRTVYVGSPATCLLAQRHWGITETNPVAPCAPTPPNPAIPYARPVFPYPAPFIQTHESDTGAPLYDDQYFDRFRGQVGTFQGVLPFNRTQGCDPVTERRCLPGLIGWTTSPWAYEAGGWGTIEGADPLNCFWEGDARVCEGTYKEDAVCSDPACGGLVIGLTATFSNVALGLRALDGTKVEIFAHNDPLPFDESIAESGPTTASVSLASNGTATVTVTGTVPNVDSRGWGTHAVFRLRLRREVIGDHALLDPNDPTTGWFVRNEWYRLLYYAIAQGHAAVSLPSPACTTGTNCLTVGAAPDNNKRVLLVLEGRSLGTQVRPSAALSDFLETTENTDTDALFEQPRVTASVNDRVIVVDQN